MRQGIRCSTVFSACWHYQKRHCQLSCGIGMGNLILQLYDLIAIGKHSNRYCPYDKCSYKENDSEVRSHGLFRRQVCPIEEIIASFMNANNNNNNNNKYQFVTSTILFVICFYDFLLLLITEKKCMRQVGISIFLHHEI